MKPQLKLVMLALAVVIMGALRAGADDGVPQEKQKVYGVAGPTAIAVTVSRSFDEEGVHYIPARTRFLDFVKSIHMKPGMDPMSSIHVNRRGRKVTDTYRTTQQAKEKRDQFVLEDGDVIDRSWYNW